MSRSEWIRLSGWAFIAGSIALLTMLSGTDSIAFPGSMFSALLLGAGMLSLRAGYGEKISRFGRNILLIGMIGMFLWYLALGALAAMSSAGILHAAPDLGERVWPVIFGGPAVVLLGLTLFGLIALRDRPMSRLNWLPALAGIWYPVSYALTFAYVLSHNGSLPYRYLSFIEFTFLIQFLALCLLGATLVIDSQKQTATA